MLDRSPSASVVKACETGSGTLLPADAFELDPIARLAIQLRQSGFSSFQRRGILFASGPSYEFMRPSGRSGLIAHCHWAAAQTNDRLLHRGYFPRLTLTELLR